jgi:hypothetical protein
LKWIPGSRCARPGITEPYLFFFRFDFFAAFFFVALRFFEAFFGTFLPFALASDRPIAIACLRLLTFLPERPLFNVPAMAFLRLSSFWQKVITGGMQSSPHVIIRLH